MAVVKFNLQDNDQLFLNADHGKVVEVLCSSGGFGGKIDLVSFLLKPVQDGFIAPGESKPIDVHVFESLDLEVANFPKSTMFLIEANHMSEAIQVPR